MKIKWLSHPNKPELNGTEQHVARELAHVAIGYGQAELCPLPKRGTNEYLKWKAEQVAAAVPQATDTAILYVSPAQWTAVQGDGSTWSCTRVIKKEGFESFSYSTPPADCPAGVAKRWRELKGATPMEAVNQAERERARIAQETYDLKSKNFKRW